MIRETRKTSLSIEKLHNLEEMLEYYCSNTPHWDNILKDIKEIEGHIIELSSDKKVDHARLAAKLKIMFFKENKELKKENKELKKEIEGLKNDRKTEKS